MIPVAVVAVGVVGALAGGGVVAGIVSEYHSDHSDHSDHYSDEAEQKREAERKKLLDAAKDKMNITLSNIRDKMASEAGDQGDIFRNWNITANSFEYKNFPEEYGRLDKEARAKIDMVVENTFASEQKACQQELDEINQLLTRIANTKLGN